MSAPVGSDPGKGLDAALGRVRRSVWLVLGACALVVFTQDAADPEPPPHRVLTTAAVALAFAAVVMRMLATSPVAGLRLRVAAVLVGYVSIVAIGGIGVIGAVQHGAVQTGLLFCAGALLLSLRPPPRLSGTGPPSA